MHFWLYVASITGLYIQWYMFLYSFIFKINYDFYEGDLM